MRVCQFDEREGLDRLSLVEKPDPTPGDHQIVIRMRAASLNHRDGYSVVVLLPFRVEGGKVVFDAPLAQRGEADIFLTN